MSFKSVYLQINFIKITHVPSVKFHTFTKVSPLQDANNYSTGENATSQTPLLWPFKIILQPRVAESHILIVLSWELEAISLSFGENLTEFISFSWANYVFFDVLTIYSSSVVSDSTIISFKSQIFNV